MDPVKLELFIELAVVLLGPPLYQYYLWRRGRVTLAQVRKAAWLFAPLYGLLLVGCVLWWLQ
ncbi:MAG: hypothetical protein EBU07_00975 [Betaproteobacteria bacterium]|jgi:hypothetical protein|nr:hypothetical protein [Betaproteobacteria bacterium]NBS45504.1 hypothetical protein [Betaproteobacteria bacterium]